MAILAKSINLAFSVAPEKKDQFLKDVSESKAINKLLERGTKHIPGFEGRTAKRK